MQNVQAIVQARMTSVRLPGKVLMDIGGRPALAHIVDRLSRVPQIDGIVIATSIRREDDAIADAAKVMGVTCFRGSEQDVLSRYAGAAALVDADTVIRVTGDCPLLDPDVVTGVLSTYGENHVDFVSNTLLRTYPIGLDVAIFSRDALDAADEIATNEDEREHVTLYIYRHPERFSQMNVAAPPELTDPELRLTLDTPEDLAFLREVFSRLYTDNPNFGLTDVLALLSDHPHLREINRDVVHKWVKT